MLNRKIEGLVVYKMAYIEIRVLLNHNVLKLEECNKALVHLANDLNIPYPLYLNKVLDKT